jgi:hypothetical protein
MGNPKETYFTCQHHCRMSIISLAPKTQGKVICYLGSCTRTQGKPRFPHEWGPRGVSLEYTLRERLSLEFLPLCLGYLAQGLFPISSSVRIYKKFLLLRKVKSICVSTKFFELLYSRCTVIRLYTGHKIIATHECTMAFGDYKLNRSLGDLHLSHDWKIFVSTIARWHARIAHFSFAFCSFIDVCIEESMSYNILVKLT